MERWQWLIVFDRYRTFRGQAITDSNSNYYRQRAAQMMKQAETAQTEALRRSYLAIAENWQRLADLEEKTPPEEDS